MSSAPTKTYLTPEQYEEIEEQSEIRHDYYRGEMFAMPVSTLDHVLIAGNIAFALGNKFENRRCTVFQSAMRVKVRATGLYTYPDVVAVCGPTQFDHAKKTSLINPMVVFEVLSPSTELYDRTTKLDHYKAIESLVEIVLVAQDHARVELFRRTEDRWEWSTHLDLKDILRLESVGCELPLARVYHEIELRERTSLRQVVEDED